MNRFDHRTNEHYFFSLEYFANKIVSGNKQLLFSPVTSPNW
jgi:hypothetical protein